MKHRNTEKHRKTSKTANCQRKLSYLIHEHLLLERLAIAFGEDATFSWAVELFLLAKIASIFAQVHGGRPFEKSNEIEHSHSRARTGRVVVQAKFCLPLKFDET